MAGRSEEALELVRESSGVLDELDHPNTGCSGGTPRRPGRSPVTAPAPSRTGRRRSPISATGDLEPRPLPARMRFSNWPAFYCDEGRWDEAAELLAQDAPLADQVPRWAPDGSRSRRAWRRTVARSPRRWRWPSAQSRRARLSARARTVRRRCLAGPRRGAASSGKRRGGRRRGSDGARALREEGQRRRRRTRAGTHRSSMSRTCTASHLRGGGGVFLIRRSCDGFGQRFRGGWSCWRAGRLSSSTLSKACHRLLERRAYAAGNCARSSIAACRWRSAISPMAKIVLGVEVVAAGEREVA